MNTAAAIATPALARPADAACCTTVGRVLRDSLNTSVPPWMFHAAWNEKMMTVISAGFWFGMTTCQQMRNIPAPSGTWVMDWCIRNRFIGAATDGRISAQ